MTRKYTLSPEGLAKRRAANRRLNADPDFKAKVAAAASARKVYQKLRNCGVAKAAALAEAVR